MIAITYIIKTDKPEKIAELTAVCACECTVNVRNPESGVYDVTVEDMEREELKDECDKLGLTLEEGWTACG